MEEELDVAAALRLIENEPAIDGLQVALMNQTLNKAQTEAELWADERKSLIDMRDSWSNWIKFLLIMIVLADIALVFGIGLGKLHFNDGSLFPIFIADSIIKTIGLAYIIVHFLFHKDSLGTGGKSLSRTLK